MAARGSTVTAESAQSTSTTSSPAGSSSSPEESAPSAYSTVPDTRPESARRSPPRATPAVTRPEHRDWSTTGSVTTRVASAVVATGPGIRARAASSTIAHKSSTDPPAPPAASLTATSNSPSSAMPPYTCRQASGRPPSISRTAAGAPAPAAQLRTRSRAADCSSVMVTDTVGSSGRQRGFDTCRGPLERVLIVPAMNRQVDSGHTAKKEQQCRRQRRRQLRSPAVDPVHTPAR